MNLMSTEWGRKPVFSFSRIKTPERKISTKKLSKWKVWKKYLARDHDIRTERSEVCASWPRAKYLPVQPDQSQSISILSYDHLALKISKIWFSHSRTRYTGARGRTTKNIRQLKNFCFVFSSQSKNITIHRKTRLCFYPFFLQVFATKSCVCKAK